MEAPFCETCNGDGVVEARDNAYRAAKCVDCKGEGRRYSQGDEPVCLNYRADESDFDIYDSRTMYVGPHRVEKYRGDLQIVLYDANATLLVERRQIPELLTAINHAVGERGNSLVSPPDWAEVAADALRDGRWQDALGLIAENKYQDKLLVADRERVDEKLELFIKLYLKNTPYIQSLDEAFRRLLAVLIGNTKAFDDLALDEENLSTTRDLNRVQQTRTGSYVARMAANEFVFCDQCSTRHAAPACRYG